MALNTSKLHSNEQGPISDISPRKSNQKQLKSGSKPSAVGTMLQTKHYHGTGPQLFVPEFFESGRHVFSDTNVDTRVENACQVASPDELRES